MSRDELTSADRGHSIPLSDFLEAQAVQPMPAETRERIRARVLPVPNGSVLRDTRLSFARAAAVFACCGTLMGGVSYAAAHSLPGDPLYPLKRATQEMRVAFVSAEFRGDVLIELSDTRVEEVRLLMLQQADEMRVQRAVEGFGDAAERAVQSSPDTPTAQQRVRRIEDAVSDEPASVQQRVKSGIPEAYPGESGTGGGAGTGGDSTGDGGSDESSTGGGGPGGNGGAGPVEGGGTGDTGTGPADTQTPGTSGTTEGGSSSQSHDTPSRP